MRVVLVQKRKRLKRGHNMMTREDVTKKKKDVNKFQKIKIQHELKVTKF